MPAKQCSLTSVLPLSRLQSPPDQFTGRKYRWIRQTDPGFFKNLFSENLPVTEKSAAPTIPVLTAGSPVTEFNRYKEICCCHYSSADSRLTCYRGYRLQSLPVTKKRLQRLLVTEICCSHHYGPSCQSVRNKGSPFEQLLSTSPVRTAGLPVTENCW